MDDIRDTLIKESQSWSTRISDVRTGKHDCLEIFVDRLSLYSSCIGTVCKEGSGYGKTVVENGENVLLDLVCGSLLSAHEDLTLTLDDLRVLALAQHIQLLLESQGYSNQQNDMCAQSDQTLCCALNRRLRIQGFYMQTANTLIILGACSG